MPSSETIYRLLLKAYPAHFAREHAEDMLQLFRDQLRCSSSRKHLWLWAMKDYLPSLWYEHFSASRRDPAPIRTVVKRIAFFSPSFFAGLLFITAFLSYRGVRRLILQRRNRCV
jgi:hypothetical protein